MSKEATVQPVKDEVKTSEGPAPVVENKTPVTAETGAAEAGPAKKAVAEKPAPTPKTKAPAKPAKKAPAAAKEKVAEAPKAEKAAKLKKPKLVRDSFTIPETDYALFATLKQRALTAGIEVKKSEILRAAVVTLAQLDDAALVKAIGLVERIKTGRPKK